MDAKQVMVLTGAFNADQRKAFLEATGNHVDEKQVCTKAGKDGRWLIDAMIQHTEDRQKDPSLIFETSEEDPHMRISNDVIVASYISELSSTENSSIELRMAYSLLTILATMDVEGDIFFVKVNRDTPFLRHWNLTFKMLTPLELKENSFWTSAFKMSNDNFIVGSVKLPFLFFVNRFN
jgi:hypothetical protein